MKNLLSIAIAFLPLFASAQMPFDGQKSERFIIDMAIPDAAVVDLSQAEPSGSFETVYSVYGDSLVCASSGGSNSWLVAREDGLWAVGWNDRVTQRRLSRGVMHLPCDFSARICSDSITVTSVGCSPLGGRVVSALEPGRAASFVFDAGDTVCCPVCVVERRSESVGGAELCRVSRRWYAYGGFEPAVQADSCFVPASGLAWSETTIGRPPHGAEPSKAPRKAPRLSETASEMSVAALPDAHMRVFDLWGRFLAEGSPDCVEPLPQGVYIAEIVGGDEPRCVKFRK